VQELYYQGEPVGGKPSRVFAFLARPSGIRGEPSPGIVLVHGGGGKAFIEWARHWAKRGYVALAMDLSGNGPAGKLPDGGPDQADKVKFREFDRESVHEMWTYHAVAAVIRGHSLLQSLPEVDARRTGITGISWGGYLTCIVAGLDQRFKVAAPVYGCGFLGENSVWKDGSLAAMSEESRELWLELFDPRYYVGRIRCPILFLNGTTDFAYPLDSYQKTYRQVPQTLRSVVVVPDLPHGHIWTFPEVDAFVDSVIAGGVRLPKAGPAVLEGNTLAARVTTPLPLKEATLCYTTSDGPWPGREWRTIPAQFRGDQVMAILPEDRPRVAFLAGADTRGLRFSSEHLELARSD
jgi:dienelactone hydrolase